VSRIIRGYTHLTLDFLGVLWDNLFMAKNSVWVEKTEPAEENDSREYFCGDFRGNNWNAPLFGLLRTVQNNKYSFAQALIVLSTPPNKNQFLESDMEWRKQTRIAVLHYSVKSLSMNSEIDQQKIEQLWSMLADLERNSNSEELPVDTFNSFPIKSRRKLWLLIRQFWMETEPWFFSQIKTNRKSVLDYLNLQALGVDEYQKTIASNEEDPKTNPLTVRDRIQYARKMGWLDKPSHGSRKSNQLRLNSKETDK
jgi:hypothetical protein